MITKDILQLLEEVLEYLESDLEEGMASIDYQPYKKMVDAYYRETRELSSKCSGVQGAFYDTLHRFLLGLVAALNCIEGGDEAAELGRAYAYADAASYLIDTFEKVLPEGGCQ